MRRSVYGRNKMRDRVEWLLEGLLGLELIRLRHT